MRQLLPFPITEVDPFDAYLPEGRTEPLLRVNMISSADGAATDEQGRTAGLAGEGDRRVFRVLRAQADAILVGAETVRAEGYGPHRMTAALRQRREQAGYGGPAPIVVVSRSLAFDLDAPLFTEAATRTVVLACEASPPERRDAVARVARVLVAGDERVDVGEGVALLRAELGCHHILCEGGPSLNVALFDSGLVDELCLTYAPLLVGRAGPRILGRLTGRVPMRLASLLEEDSELYARYTVSSSTSP